MSRFSATRHPRLSVAIVALGITQIIGWGTTFYLPAVVAQAVAEEGLISKTHYLVSFSWCLLLAGLLARRLGRLIDRIGAAPVLATGSLVSALGLALQSIAHEPWLIWLSWTSIGVMLRAVLYDGAFAALTALSGSQARRSISLITLMGGLASTVFWPIGAWLVEWSDWRMTLMVYAALNLFVCAPLHWWCAGQVASRSSTPGAPIRAETASPAQPPAKGIGSSTDSALFREHGLRERAILLFSSALALHGFISYGLSTHLPSLLQGLGLQAGAAIIVASLMGPAQVLARIVELRLQRSIPTLSLTIPIFLLMPLAFVGFASLQAVPASQAAVAGALVVMIWGASNGLMTIIRGSLPITLFGTAGYGEVLGRLAAPTLFMGAIAPVLFGLAIEWLGPAGASLFLLVLGVLSTGLAGRLVRLARNQAASSIHAC